MMRKLFKKQDSATTAAFWVSPIVPGVVLPFLDLLSWQSSHLGYALLGILACYILSLAIGMLVGLPMFLLFSRLRLFSWWGSMLAGFLSGDIIVAVVGALSNLEVRALLIYGALGAATGLTFWAVAVLGPDANASAASDWVKSSRKRRE
jgi:hypothetical protein